MCYCQKFHVIDTISHKYPWMEETYYVNVSFLSYTQGVFHKFLSFSRVSSNEEHLAHSLFKKIRFASIFKETKLIQYIHKHYCHVVKSQINFAWAKSNFMYLDG